MRNIWRLVCQEYEESLKDNSVFDVQAFALEKLSYEAYKQSLTAQAML